MRRLVAPGVVLAAVAVLWRRQRAFEDALVRDVAQALENQRAELERWARQSARNIERAFKAGR